MDVYARLARHVPGLSAIEIKERGGFEALEISSRIFTPREQAPTMEWADIDNDIDINGFIQGVKMSDAPFVYGEENVVYYGEEKVYENGEVRTEKIRPDKLHVGDIVDVAFSVVGLERGKGKGGIAKLLLRSVEIIDGTHTQEYQEDDIYLQQKWIKNKALSGRKTEMNQAPLKKRKMFDEGEVEETRKRFKKLTTRIVEEQQ
ncbi:hypothetical protein HHX47_DHR6000778 [Lentinula edodes]|nr:hypothetical protein HHX47_DHR6000778 [Lentinula edodes]